MSALDSEKAIVDLLLDYNQIKVMLKEACDDLRVWNAPLARKIDRALK